MIKLNPANCLTAKQKVNLKKIYNKITNYFANNYFSYDSTKLKNALYRIGVRPGDTLMVHSAFHSTNGFKGTPSDITKCLIDFLGKDGNLLMVSMPFQGSAYDYLRTNPVFNVKRTVSGMGIISEAFRRKEGVLRSRHPTHPVLAFGKDAAWIIEGHEKCLFPCGVGTPFEKFRSLNGKVLFFDVPFDTFTMIHYIENLFQDQLPVPIFREKTMSASVADPSGNVLSVQTYVFSEESAKLRNPSILETCYRKNKLLAKCRVGNTRLMLLEMEPAIECVKQMLDEKIYFYKSNVH